MFTILKKSNTEHLQLTNLKKNIHIVRLPWSTGKDPPVSAGDIRDVGLIPGSGRSLGGGHGNPFLYYCLENPMDWGVWQATVHKVTKSLTQLNRLSTAQHTYTQWLTDPMTSKFQFTNSKSHFMYICIFLERKSTCFFGFENGAAAAAKSFQSCPWAECAGARKRPLWPLDHLSNSLRPHRQQPTRLPRPWDSPGKNTGVGCHFLLQCMKVKSESEVSQSCPTLSDPMDFSLPGSSGHGIFQARVLEWGAIAFSLKKVLHCQMLRTSEIHINSFRDKSLNA